MLMMLVSCATVPPVKVLTWVLPLESICCLATFLTLESPFISLLQECEPVWPSGKALGW